MIEKSTSRTTTIGRVCLIICLFVVLIFCPVSVRDSGVGIAPEDLDKVFQPLFTTKARGIGLGLVVAKNLTEANGGRVEVRSEPGKGATFFVTLPAAEVVQSEAGKGTTFATRAERAVGGNA